MMCEQTGEEIDWDRCPPELDDFPDTVQTALGIFYTLGDRVYADVGFTGKDYTNFDFILEFYMVTEKATKDWILEIILFLETRQIRRSQDQIKSEMDKIKRK